jgi:hypothetical protein
MSYEWAKIPTDLPKANLVLITAKTTRSTSHKGYVCPINSYNGVANPNFKTRVFNPDEMAESGASLRRRPIGLNHANIIEKAFTVDAQFNKKTMALEALCYFPTAYMDIMRGEVKAGKRVQFSVEYFFRDAKFTESGAELIGICFDRVDLLLGLDGGDTDTSMKFVESADHPNRDSIGAELDTSSLINGETMSEADIKLKESEELAEKKLEIKSLSKAVELLSSQKEAAEAAVRERDIKLKESMDAKALSDSSVLTMTGKLTEAETKLKSTQEVLEKAQDNITKFSNEKAIAVEEAVLATKKEDAAKIAKVLPEVTMRTGSGVGAHTVATSVREALKKL